MSGAASAPKRSMLPREHGAWGLLFQPFLAGAVLARLEWPLLTPAILLLLAGFAVRAPLLHLARGWRQGGLGPAGTRAALVWAAAETALLAVSFALLWPRLPHAWRIGLPAGGAAFTLLAIWIGLRNWQRSRTFQTLSAAVLALSAPLAAQLGQGKAPAWSWALWTIFVLHGAAAIQLVHERLEHRIAARAGSGASLDSRPFFTAVGLQLAGGLALAAFDWRWLLPPLVSSLYALAEWRTLSRRETLREPLVRVGWRTLAFAVFHMLLAIAAFWPAARLREI